MYSYLHCNNNDFIQEEYFDKCSNINKEIKICLGELSSEESQNTLINGYVYQTNIILDEIEVLFNKAKKVWRQAEDIIFTETSNPNVLDIRAQIVDLLIACRVSAFTYKIANLKSQKLITMLTCIDLMKQVIYSIHEMGNNIIAKLLSTSIRLLDTSVSIYFHMYFDVKWLILTIEHICCRPIEIVEDTYRNILKDLVCLGHKFYLKHKSTNNRSQSNPFICKCIKQVWIFLQRFSIEILGSINKFWDIFGIALKNHEEVFSFWLLYHIATLQFYDNDGNFLIKDIDPTKVDISFIDQNLKILLSNTINVESDTLKESLEYMEPILNKYWLNVSKIEPYQLLWDYYYKNLNDCNLSIPKTSVCLIEHVNKVTNGLQKSTYNSFDIFLNMLVTHLKRNPTHWSKLRGRIYSRLPVNKLQDFNEKGIYNVSILFMVLASINFEEVIKKLKDLVENLPINSKYAEQIWIIHMSMVTLHVQYGKKIEKSLIDLIQNLLEEASANREQYYLIKTFVEGLDYVINTSNNLQLNQSLLFGKWINRYIQSCQYTDLCFLLNTITWTVEITYREGLWFEWSNIFVNNVLPGLKQISTTSASPPQTGKLAASIVRNSPELIPQYLNYFAGESVNVKISNQFLNVLLEDYPENRIISAAQEQVVIQAWARYILFNTENNDQLSEKVIKFGIFTCLDIKDLSQEPFLTFIKAVHAHSTNMMLTNRLKEMFDTCFGSVDRTIATYLINPTSEATTLQLYTNMAYLVYHCSNLLYHKTKSNCLLSRLINVLLLPTEILMGKIPSPLVLRSIDKTWHLFFQGVFNLNFSIDPFLERTLKDLVIRYLLLFPPSSSPLLKCLNDRKQISFILEKLCAAYISNTSKSLEENTFKALRAVNIILQNAISFEIVQIVVQKVLPGILEVIMFHTQKNTAIESIKALALSEYYVQIRDDIKQAIRIVTEKHLPFSSNNYFQMVLTLIKLIPLDIRDLLPDIKKQIVIVERMRAVGFDNTLRQHFHRVESALNS